ncbi:hypothetical protein ACFS07_33350 [Undibacterium arcticum]
MIHSVELTTISAYHLRAFGPISSSSRITPLFLNVMPHASTHRTGIFSCVRTVNAAGHPAFSQSFGDIPEGACSSILPGAAMYFTQHMQSLRREYPLGAQDPDPFVQHLYQIASKFNRPYNVVMTRNAGDPSGVEYHNRAATLWAFVLPDASEPGKYRLQTFDEDGFTGHSSYSSLIDAVEALIKNGYVCEDRGALDRMSTTARWAAGTEILDLLRRLNGKEISFQEYGPMARSVKEKNTA